jgi:hypothetical protein
MPPHLVSEYFQRLQLLTVKPYKDTAYSQSVLRCNFKFTVTVNCDLIVTVKSKVKVPVTSDSEGLVL